jgi:hypothetical protein
MASGTNFPDSGWYYVNTVMYSSTSKGRKQIAYGHPSSNNVYVRTRDNSGTWKAWTSLSPVSSIAWGSVTGKPSTFPPSSHTHSNYLEKTLIRTGTFTATSTSSTSVSFSSAMPSTPYVFVTYCKTGANVSGGWGSPKVHSVTTSGFSCIIGGSTDTTARALNYFALSY